MAEPQRGRSVSGPGAALRREIVVTAAGEAVEQIRGAIAVGPGDPVADVQRARAQRGRERARR